METPDWVKKENIKFTLDARPLLASGQHPLERVLQEGSTLKSGEIYEIMTPFPPMPMIEKMEEIGFISSSVQDAAGVFHTYFLKK